MSFRNPLKNNQLPNNSEIYINLVTFIFILFIYSTHSNAYVLEFVS